MIIGSVIILLVAGVVFLILAARVPVLQVVVVNEAGTPVAGAKIKPDGIRGTDGGHYGWGDDFSVKPLPVTTDAKGKAKIPYPRFIVERVRSIELSFGVDHPDYASSRPFVKVAAPIRSTTPFVQRLQFIYEDFQQSGKTERIVLKESAAIELSAQVGGRQIAATNFHAQLVPENGEFDGVFARNGERLSSKKLPAGGYMVRGCARVDGTNYFSEVLTFTGVVGETNVAALELKPGYAVEGRLSEVQGAITNGWVNAKVINKGVRETMSWADFAEVRRDGTFQLSGLPAGKLEVVAICDGYLSANPTRRSTFVMPHIFDLPAGDRIEIPMRRSAVANIRVLGPKDEPVAGASVHFWPNIQWGGYLSTVFATDFYREMDGLEQRDPSRRWERSAKRSYSGKTGADGRAIVRELPPEMLSFVVEYSELEMPLNNGRREDSIQLIGGETNFTAVKLQQKSGEMRD